MFRYFGSVCLQYMAIAAQHAEIYVNDIRTLINKEEPAYQHIHFKGTYITKSKWSHMLGFRQYIETHRSILRDNNKHSQKDYNT